MANQLKVFIAGAPRSGTSILLFALKDVFGLEGYGESHVMPAISEMAHACYKYLQPFKQMDKALADEMMVGSLLLPDIKAHLFEFVRRFYKIHFPADSWVDKTPSSPGVFSLAMAAEAFPDAKLIVTYRNGIEVVSSHVKKFGVSFEEACDIWTSAMEGLTTIRPLCKNLLAVDQFDFSNSTDRVSVEIAKHLESSEKVAELVTYLRDRRVEASSEHDWSRRLRLQDMSWTDQSKAIFKDKCGSTMREYGYEL